MNPNDDQELDNTQATTQPSDDDSSGIQDIEILENRIKNLEEKNLQLIADFRNYQRRMDEEKAIFGALSNMALIQESLEVYDDMNLALQDESLDLDQAKSSLKSAQDKLVSAIERAGVERIEVSVGDEFDKEKMEAISTTPSEDNKGKIVAVISSAFKYRDKDGILKAAKVIVGK